MSSEALSPTAVSPLWTYGDIERETGIRATTARWFRHKGEFAPAIKIGRRVYFDPEDVRSWIDAHREAEAA